MSIRSNAVAPVVVAVLLAVTVVACGGSSGAEPTDTPVAPTEVPSTGGTGATEAPSAASEAPAQPTEDVPPAAVLPQACDLLSDEDIEEVLEREVQERIPNPLSVWPDGCQFVLADTPTAGVADLYVGVMAEGARAMFDESFAPFVAEMDQEFVEGVGDVAIRSGRGELMAVQGDTLVDVQYLSGMLGAPADVVNGHAQAIVLRLLERIAES